MVTLSLPGAVPPPSQLDSGVAWHYGHPLAEQRRLAAGDAVVDLSHLGVIGVTGPDRLSWLHDLTTAHVRDLAAGESRLALILDHNGRVQDELHVVDDGECTWLIVEPDRTQPLVEYLESMRFLLRVEVHDKSADVAVVAADPRAGVQPALGHWRVPPDFSGAGFTPSGADAGGDPTKYVPRRPGEYCIDEWLVPRDVLADVLARASSLAGTWALTAERVGAGVPRVAIDADSRALPHELGLIGAAVHLDKGCYRGQESVARTHNMGRPPRRLVQLLFDDGENLPEPGGEVLLEGRRVGRLGTVVQHVDLGPVALALVKRNVDPDSGVLVDGHVARQVIVVSPN
jgi:folate-binding protein YgfZ